MVWVNLLDSMKGGMGDISDWRARVSNLVYDTPYTPPKGSKRTGSKPVAPPSTKPPKNLKGILAESGLFDGLPDLTAPPE